MAKKKRRSVSMSPVTYERLRLLSEIVKREGHPLAECVPSHCQDPTSLAALVEAMIHHHADVAQVDKDPILRPARGIGGVRSW